MRVTTHSKSSKNLRHQVKEIITLDVNHQQYNQEKRVATNSKEHKELDIFFFLVQMLHEKWRSETLIYNIYKLSRKVSKVTPTF